MQQPSLLDDTLARRARRAAASALHAADDAAQRLRHPGPQVLFEAASPLSLAVFRPVLERLRADSRLSMWYTIADCAWDAASVFGGEPGARVLPPARAAWMKFDAYINTDFWNMTWLRRRARRLHLFHGVAGKYQLDAPIHIAPVVATFDRLMFPNRDRLERYVEAGLVDADSLRAALVGYPKVDCLVDGSLDPAAIRASLGLAPAAPTILYAPTWSPYSSLNAIGESLIPALGRMSPNTIVKLHDRCFERVRGGGDVDWRARLVTLCREWGVHFVEDADISKYLVVSDVLVTDHSSAGFEFMLLDRPIVVIDCPELIQKARISRDKVALLRGAADVVEASVDAVLQAVRTALAEPDTLSDRRRAVADTLFYRPGGATGRAVQCFYDALGIPALATERPPRLSSLEARSTDRA